MKVRRQGGVKMEVCVYITQNKLSERSINTEPVNICARPVPTNRNLYQGNRVNADSHKHLWEKVVWKAEHSPSSLCFPAFHSVFYSGACRCADVRTKTGSWVELWLKICPEKRAVYTERTIRSQM